MKLMMVMEHYQKFNNNNNSSYLKVFGFGLIKILEVSKGGFFKVIFQKGMGIPFIQNILELYKKEIVKKKQGNSIIPLDDITIFFHYFEDKQRDITLIIYMNKKEITTNFTKMYLISKKINKFLSSNDSISEIKQACNSMIDVPRTEGVIAIFIIGDAGSPYFSKIKKNRSIIADKEVHVSGFLSALFTFSKEIIHEESGAKLKEINFGNQRFYMITKKEVIFAYLVEDMNPLVQRYMYLIVDVFLEEYNDHIKQFNGDVSPFKNFKNIINQYFII